MATDVIDMGGRLPLFSSDALTPDQQQAYGPINTLFVPWADAAGFRSKDESGRLIGPFNSVLSSPEISRAFLDSQIVEQAYTSLDRRTREVVILTVGAIWRSSYVLYAHATVARQAGLTDSVIEQLCAGGEPDGLGPAEAIARQCARQLTADHQIRAELFEAANATFGLKGLVDLIHLVGAYQTICAILNAFAIPIPQA